VVFRFGGGEVDDRIFRDQQDVDGGLGGDIPEGEAEIIFVDNISGDFAADDFAEDGVGHRFWCGMMSRINPITFFPDNHDRRRCTQSLAGISGISVLELEVIEHTPIVPRHCGNFMSNELNDLQTRKLLSALCHVSTFLTWFVAPFVIPIVILCVSNDSVVQANAKEAINYYISFLIYYTIAIILCFVLIGFVLLIPILIMDFIFPIIAIIKTLENPDRVYRYPSIIRFF
jgi:uncharacterized protein